MKCVGTEILELSFDTELTETSMEERKWETGLNWWPALLNTNAAGHDRKLLSKGANVTMDIILNLTVFSVTLVLVVRFFRKDKKWDPERGKNAFRFFTCQSNVICAVSALLTAVAELSGSIPEWIRILKYIGTSAVTVTMLTVFLFLAPSIGKGWAGKLLKGSELFMHLLTPLAALISCCFYEKHSMSFAQSLWGMLPVVYYGPLYLYKTIYAPPDRRWKDFYGFNKSGRWPVSFMAMFIGTFLICMGLMALQNL